MKKRLVLSLAGITALMLGAAFGITHVIPVIIRNNGEEIESITLGYSGGTQVSKELLAQRSLILFVSATKESELSLTFYDTSKKLHELRGGYFEPGYAGYFVFEIDSFGNITLSNKTVPLPRVFY